MGVHCVLCTNNTDGGKKDISYHGFPKDPLLKAKWLKFCRLTEEEVFKTNKVCSDHFVDENFVGRKAPGAHRALIHGSVPSVRRKSRKNEGNISLNVSLPSEISTPSNQTSSDEIQVCLPTLSTPPTLPTPILDNFIIVKEEHEEEEEITFTEHEDPLNVPSSPVCENVDIVDIENSYRPLTRCKPTLRYIGDITYDDMESPKTAKIALGLAKTTIGRLRAQVKYLGQRNRRLERKMKNLQDLVRQLRRKETTQQII